MNNSLKKITDNNIPPLIYLFGEEDYLLEKELDYFLNKFVPNKQDSFSFEQYNSEDIDLKSLVATASSIPMLIDLKFILVTNFDKYFSKKSTKKDNIFSSFEKYLENPSKSTCLILVGSSNNFSKNKKQTANIPLIKNLILKNHYHIEYKKLNDNNLVSWIDNQFKENNKKIEKEIIQTLIFQTNSNIRILGTEIEKLLLFTLDKENISIDDLESVLGVKRNYNIYELQKSISKRDIRNSLEILNNISNSTPALNILGMIRDYFLKLWVVSEQVLLGMNRNDIANNVSINSYFIQEYIDSSKKYNLSKIEEIISYICLTDENIKTTSSNSSFEIEKLIIKIIE